jgi:hypothetical protein
MKMPFTPRLTTNYRAGMTAMTTLFTGRIGSFIRLISKMTLARLEAVIVPAYFVILAIAVFRLAALRPLWYDELFTLHLAKVSSVRDLLSHLAAGVDLNPPVIYLATRACILLFGDAEWAVRLPALAGMLLGLAGVYTLLRPRLGFATALLALTIIVAPVKVWTYFLEARPYGLTFGFSALALLAWARCNGSRRWTLTLAAASFLGVSTHYYFTLTLAALGIAEVVRWIEARRIRVGPMLAMSAGAMALAACYPLWSVAPRDYAAGFWAKVSFNRGTVEDTFMNFLDRTAILPFVIAVVLTGIGHAVSSRRIANHTHDDESRLPLHETIALGLFVLCPVLGVLLGAKVTGGFFYRYALPAAIGFGALFALLLANTARTRVAILTCAAVFAWFGLTGSIKPYKEFFQHEKNLMTQLRTVLDEQCLGEKVIIETGYEFARDWHYHQGRMHQPLFLADAERARHYSQIDTTERAVQLLKRVTPVPAQTGEEIVTALRRGEAIFYYGPCTAWGYKDLLARGIQFELKSDHPGGKLLRLNLH